MSPAESRTLSRQVISLEYKSRRDPTVFSAEADWDDVRLAALHVHRIVELDRETTKVHLWDDAALAMKATVQEDLKPEVNDLVKRRALQLMQTWLCETQRHSDKFQRYSFESPTEAIHAA